MKLFTNHYCVIEEDGLFYVYKEKFLFDCFSFSGEKISKPYENLVDAETHLEQILNPQSIELL